MKNYAIHVIKKTTHGEDMLNEANPANADTLDAAIGRAIEFLDNADYADADRVDIYEDTVGGDGEIESGPIVWTRTRAEHNNA